MIEHVFIINGYPRSGKDTFVDIFNLAVNRHNTGHGTENRYAVRVLSTVDKVKEVAKEEFGWNGEKDEKSRNMLHSLKMTWSAFNDGPYQSVIEELRNINDFRKRTVVFVMSREPEEIARFKAELPWDCSTLLIKRDKCDMANNYADKNVENFEYDHIIWNEDVDNWKDYMYGNAHWLGREVLLC